MPIISRVCNLLMSITLIVTAIGCIFFLYTSMIEAKIVTSQTDSLISGVTSDMKVLLTPEQQNVVMTAFKNMKPPDMSSQDKDASNTNSKLLKKASLVLGIVLVSGVSIVLICSWIFKFSFIDIVKENLVMLLVACAVEVVFISLFARNLKSLDSNMVKYNIIKAFQDYANNTTSKSYSMSAWPLKKSLF